MTDAAAQAGARLPPVPALSLPAPRTHPVLILPYDPESAGRLTGVLREAGYPVRVTGSFRELAEAVGSAEPTPLVVLAGAAAEPGARELLAGLRDRPQRVPVLALAERLDRERAEALRRMGVDEALETSFDPAEVLLVARRLLARSELERSTRIAGRSPAIQEVLEKVAQYAPVSSTVLIEGESGTGKELVARAIHALSPRAGQPFVALNCAALAETLLESELFGHERGAFTGAVGQRKGLFEAADRGTLFLDEVGEMAPATQVRLLRVLEERELVRVGGTEPVQVDVRVIAATNKILREAVEHGEFRRDLYYRLNVLHVDVPPLRERREDVPLLVRRFAREFAREQGRPDVEVDEDAVAILQNYDWPGNVRELRNQVERMLVLAPGTRIRPIDVPAHIYDRANPARLLPVAARRAAEKGREEWELLYRMLFELRRDVSEIRELLESQHDRGLLAGEISIDPQAVTLAERPDQEAPAAAPGAGPSDRASLPLLDGSGAADGRGRAAPFEVGTSLEEMERRAIELTLAAVGGNRRKAAGILRIGERTLYRKLKEYGLA